MRAFSLIPAILGGLVQWAAAAAGPATAAPTLPPIRHVFVLVLENMSYSHTFASDSDAPYLAHTLPGQGVLLTQYYAIGHASLDNYVAMVSGQAPNHETQLDCPTYSDFRLSAPALNVDGQALGAGCVYPSIVKTLPDQLEAAGLTWKGYMEDMGNDPRRERATCGHVPLGAADPTSVARRGDQYAAKHDPFVYFHSIIDDAARCDAHVVNLSHLPEDLASAASTPNYVFITPNLCSDGHDPKCADGREGGLVAINAFLTRWVPLIVNSAAFRTDGLLIVTFDEADGVGVEGSGACCGEKPLPGARYAPGFNGPGGGRVGAVVLSPFVRAGTVSTVPYNHYSLLRTVEAIFGLEPLGYAALPGAQLFGPDVFSGGAPHPPAR
ncbi:MAG TPA: alkaline phosphatase family protein [Steroidobacteraceae bacterium]|nr:alkaline phosphatase family protein [Steroidobacteraceae bacterium]